MDNLRDLNDLSDSFDSYTETRHALSLQSKQRSEFESQSKQQSEIESQSDTKTQSQPVLQSEKTPGQERFQNQGKNTISSIMGSYKSAVTKHAHRLGYEFDWQEKFHDNIIRDQESYNIISAYIKGNPGKWEDDKFHPSKPDTESF